MTDIHRKYELLQKEVLALNIRAEKLEGFIKALKKEVWSYQTKNAWLKQELNKAERELEKNTEK